MTFYSDPAFFVLAIAAAIPAFIAIMLGKNVKRYGMAVSCAFLLLLFSDNLPTFAFFCFYIALASAVTLVYARACKRDRGNGTPYAAALIAVIAPLAIYKVAEVFEATVFGFIGISYMTFKAVQVIIETRAGLIKDPSLFDYLYFLLFFPSFTSGPILRSRAFSEEVNSVPGREEYLGMVSLGISRLALGALYKFVLASAFSTAMWFIPKALGDASALSVIGSEIGYAYAYGLYLFFDFAGYSLMAMGLGAFFGVNVPKNFDMPFMSVDIKDFWNRWHMTLSFWLRDFVFMRFSRLALRKKLFKSRLNTACAGFIVNMTLMGAWHGLTFDYVLYGVYHGVLLAATEAYQKKSGFHKRNKGKGWYKALSWFVTLNLVMLGFAVFSGQVSSLLKGAI